MQRNLKKAVEDYNAKFGSMKNNKGAFFVNDYFQIREMSLENSEKDILLTAIDNALKAGFMIGYKCAKREEGA